MQSAHLHDGFAIIATQLHSLGLLETLLLVVSALLGGGVVVFLRFENKKALSLLVSFSGAFLLSLIFLHLLPSVFQSALPVAAGVFILGGFCIQLFLEYLSGGVEHGHSHSHAASGFPLAIFIGLCLHAFLEGMPIGHLHHEHNHSLLIGILLHKLPVAIVLAILMRSAGLKPASIMLWVGLFSLMSPLGSWSFGWLNEQGWMPGESLVAGATALLIGILLHVSTTILFEGSEGHRYNGLKLLVLAVGLVLGGLI